MKLSARNVLKGKIKTIKKGPVSSVVLMEIGPGVEITASITTDSTSGLRLKRGQAAYAIIKASNVMIGVDD